MMKFIVAVMIKLISWITTMFMNTTIGTDCKLKFLALLLIEQISVGNQGSKCLEHCCVLKRLVNSLSVT
jgi:hypothetical protein